MNLRVAAFLVAAAMLIVGWNTHEIGWFIAGGLALAGFSAAVAWHEYIRSQMLRNLLFRQVNQEAIARLHRDWTGLPQTRVEVPPPHQAVAGDLDLFGHASLFHLLCAANTPLGIRTLRDWFLDPAAAAEVGRRQQATAELRPAWTCGRR